MRLIILLIISFLLQCSSDFAGGTSSTENPKVIGYIVDNDNSLISNVEVLILPINSNPLTNDLEINGDKDTTDINGKFELEVPDFGIFNIQAWHSESNRFLLKQNLEVDSDNLNVNTLFLTNPGSLKMILPESVDTNDSYIFVKGTSIYKKLSNLNIDSNNNVNVIINDLPSGNIPEIIYWKQNTDSTTVLVPGSTEIISDDTLVINLDSLLKPTWSFPCIIGVTQQSADYFGGIENIYDSILKQFTASNYEFNRSGKFNGNFNFSVDSIYVIDGAVNNEAIKPPTGYALRVIYDSFKEGTLISNSFDDLWIYHSYGISDEGGVFGNKSQNLLNWLLGLMRGGKPLDDVEILAENNPLNNQGFTPMESIMSVPYNSGAWDSYNVNLLNHYNDDFTFEDIKFSAFPITMGVYLESSIGNPVDNADVKVYGVIIDMGIIDSNNVILSGKSSIDGSFEFIKNPFLNDALNRFLYDNILISVSVNDSKIWAWMPFYEPSNAWFLDSSIGYEKKIIIP